MKTSNKILAGYIILAIIFSIVFMSVNVSLYNKTKPEAQGLLSEITTHNIKVINISGDDEMVHASNKAEHIDLQLDRLPSQSEMYVRGDTLYVNSERSIHITIPSLEKIIRNGTEKEMKKK